MVLEATSQKECEVTGRDMGGTDVYTCPVGKLKENEPVPWEPSYGGYDTIKVTFLHTDDEAVHLNIYNSYHIEKALKPDDQWESGWWSFGSWDYHVRIKLREREDAGKPFFVHTMTDDGVTSDYADAKEAYEGK